GKRTFRAENRKQKSGKEQKRSEDQRSRCRNAQILCRARNFSQLLPQFLPDDRVLTEASVKNRERSFTGRCDLRSRGFRSFPSPRSACLVWSGDARQCAVGPFKSGIQAKKRDDRNNNRQNPPKNPCAPRYIFFPETAYREQIVREPPQHEAK